VKRSYGGKQLLFITGSRNKTKRVKKPQMVGLARRGGDWVKNEPRLTPGSGEWFVIGSSLQRGGRKGKKGKGGGESGKESWYVNLGGGGGLDAQLVRLGGQAGEIHRVFTQ